MSQYDDLIFNSEEKHYFTGKPCRRGHVAKRYISNRQCVECASRPEEKLRAKEYLKQYRKTAAFIAKKPSYDKVGKSNYRSTVAGAQKIKEYSSRAEVREKSRLSTARRRLSPEVRRHALEYEKKRAKTDPNYRLARALRARTREALKGLARPGSAIAFLGCSIEDARCHIEAQFTEGMGWENHGEWHIDHIKPLASFDLTNEFQFSQACNYKNLQPLWRAENQRKGARSQ